MNSEAKTGHWLVIAVIVAFLLFNLLSIISHLSVFGQQRIPQQMIKLLLTIGLCMILYSGANWGRWAIGIFCCIGAISNIIINTFFMQGLSILTIGGLVYGASAYILLGVPAVRAYCDYKTRIK